MAKGNLCKIESNKNSIEKLFIRSNVIFSHTIIPTPEKKTSRDFVNAGGANADEFLVGSKKISSAHLKSCGSSLRQIAQKISHKNAPSGNSQWSVGKVQ